MAKIYQRVLNTFHPALPTVFLIMFIFSLYHLYIFQHSQLNIFQIREKKKEVTEIISKMLFNLEKGGRTHRLWQEEGICGQFLTRFAVRGSIPMR